MRRSYALNSSKTPKKTEERWETQKKKTWIVFFVTLREIPSQKKTSHF